VFKQAGSYNPCVLLIQHLHAMAVTGADGNDTEEEHVGGVLSKLLAGGNNTTTITTATIGPGPATKTSQAPCLVIGTTDKPPAELPGRFVGSFVHVIPVAAPSEDERVTLLEQLLGQVAHSDVRGLGFVL
jgi:hypothetical protein